MASNQKSDTKQTPSPKPAKRYMGLSSSTLWALLFTALIGVWAITGEIKGGSSLKPDSKPDAGSVETNKDTADTEIFKVRTTIFHTKNYPVKLIIRGRTISENQIEVRAQTTGNIIKLPVNKGDYVEAGTLLCQLEDGARAPAALEAQASLDQAKADYAASKKLEKRGHAAGLKVLRNKALLNKAKAGLAIANLDLERTTIKAPFKGYVEELPAKVGSLLSIGDPCAKLVSLDPLHVVGAVRERDVQKIKPGMKGIAHLVTGETVEGTVHFISATAEEETRTFKLELIIPNKSLKLKSGVTSDIIISLPERKAILLPPSILVLNDKGEIGVRTVQPDRAVSFKPVKIISEQIEGIWVEALPSASTIITIGQDFVKEGQKVIPVSDENFKNQPGS